MIFKNRWCVGILSATLLLLVAQVAPAAVHNVANDFSSSSNPTGVWSYGFETTVGGVFTLYGNTDDLGDSSIAAWNESTGSLPAVFKNQTSSTITFAGTVQLGPNELALHPGSTGNYSVVRFTAPAAGQYSIASIFSGRSIAPNNGTTTDVHVLVNNSSVYSGVVNGFGPISDQAFNGSVALGLGGTIDFLVGYGPNGNYFYDSTALDASIAATPEPATLAIWGGIGLCGLIAGYRRKRML